MNEPGPAPQGVASVSASERPIDRARSRPVLHIRANISPIRTPDGTSATANGSSRVRKSGRSATTGMESCRLKMPPLKSLRTKCERQDGIRPVAPIDPDRCDRPWTENRTARSITAITRKSYNRFPKQSSTGQPTAYFPPTS